MKYCNEGSCYNRVEEGISYCDVHKYLQTKSLISTVQNEAMLRNYQGEVTARREEGNVFNGNYECHTVQYNTNTGNYSSTSIIFRRG